MKRIFKYFLNGLLYVAPITITLYLIWEVFYILDGLIPLDVPGLGIILVFILITCIGFLGRHLISDSIGEILETYIKKVPLINVIYTSLKDLLSAFVGDKKSFNRPVLIKLYENSEVRRLGFITNDNFKKMGKNNDLITVYIPHSYNISGNIYLVPESYVKKLDMNASDLMKYTVSGGVTHIDEKN